MNHYRLVDVAKGYFDREGYNILPRTIESSFQIEKNAEIKNVQVMAGKITRSKVGAHYFAAAPLVELPVVICTEEPVPQQIKDEFRDVEFVCVNM